MKKSYEEYTDKVVAIFTAHREEAVKIKNAVNLAVANKRLSDFGRQEAIANLRKSLSDLNQSFSDAIREIIRSFCKEYSLKFKEDNEDHNIEIANALKVIDMCGDKLNADILKSILEPLKNSHKSLKLISDVLSTRHDSLTTSISYAVDVDNVMSDFMGCNSEINEFVNRLRDIEAVADYPVLSNYNMTGSSDMYNEKQFFDINNVTPYSVDRLPEEITAVGKMYEELAMKYPLIFSNYIPTETEMIDDALKNQ